MQRVVRGLSVLLHEHLHSNLINISITYQQRHPDISTVLIVSPGWLSIARYSSPYTRPVCKFTYLNGHSVVHGPKEGHRLQRKHVPAHCCKRCIQVRRLPAQSSFHLRACRAHIYICVFHHLDIWSGCE